MCIYYTHMHIHRHIIVIMDTPHTKPRRAPRSTPKRAAVVRPTLRWIQNEDVLWPPEPEPTATGRSSEQGL